MYRLTLVVLLCAGALLSAAQGADDGVFPHTRSYGRATVQYKDARAQVVAIYDYSQKNHAGAWLLIQIGVSLSERADVTRGSFSLVAPTGRAVPLATQQQFIEDAARIVELRQNASIFDRPVLSYFPQSADGENLRWFVLPGEGTVREPAIVPSEHGIVLGELYFKSPTGRWDAGTYRLVFNGAKAHAELPIRLE